MAFMLRGPKKNGEPGEAGREKVGKALSVVMEGDIAKAFEGLTGAVVGDRAPLTGARTGWKYSAGSACCISGVGYVVEYPNAKGEE